MTNFSTLLRLLLNTTISSISTDMHPLVRYHGFPNQRTYFPPLQAVPILLSMLLQRNLDRYLTESKVKVN